MNCRAFTAERIAARLARADRPQELEPIWFMLLHGVLDRCFDIVGFWHLWDCLATLQRALPWTPTTDPAHIEQAARYGEDVRACDLQAGDRVVIRTEPPVVWTLEADPFLLGDNPMLPVAVLRFADDRCLTVPDDHLFLIPEL
jgi:hypothetical protein